MAKKSSAAKPAPGERRPDKKPPPQASFERQLGELEALVARLEEGEQPLEESLALHERGVALIKRCHAILDQAEKRIRKLTEDASGQPVLVELEAAPAGGARDAEGAEPPKKRSRAASSSDAARRKPARNPSGPASGGASLFGGS